MRLIQKLSMLKTIVILQQIPFKHYQVEFAFHHWSMDEELYRPGQFAYGSRESDEGIKKPKRTVMAGTENMSAAEAMAFIRGETRNTLGQTFAER